MRHPADNTYVDWVPRRIGQLQPVRLVRATGLKLPQDDKSPPPPELSLCPYFPGDPGDSGAGFEPATFGLWVTKGCSDSRKLGEFGPRKAPLESYFWPVWYSKGYSTRTSTLVVLHRFLSLE